MTLSNTVASSMIKNYRFSPNAFLPRIVEIPLMMEDGISYKSIVNVGDKVEEGQKIAVSSEYDNEKTFIRSSVPGTVVAIEPCFSPNGRQTFAVKIKTGGSFSYIGKIPKEKNTHYTNESLSKKLIEDGYNAAALHGDLSQNQRDLVMKSFRARQIQMLVATDVAARGIDVDDITHVIHYQLPDEIETYNHRSGRTGRAGKSGISMVILPKSEIRKIKEIERVIGQHFEQKQLPTGIEICEIQLYHLANNLKNVEVNPDIEDYLPAIHKELQDLDRETLVKKIFSVEFTRFYNYYKNAEHLSISDEGGTKNNETHSGNSVRYFINIGERDGYDWRTLKDFLKATLNLGKDEVFQVDVKNSFSFFNTESNHTALVMDTFNDFRLDGRFINVEISNKGAGRGRGGKREDEGRSKKKSQPNSRKQKTIEAFDKAFGGKKKKKK